MATVWLNFGWPLDAMDGVGDYHYSEGPGPSDMIRVLIPILNPSAETGPGLGN